MSDISLTFDLSEPNQHVEQGQSHDQNQAQMALTRLAVSVSVNVMWSVTMTPLFQQSGVVSMATEEAMWHTANSGSRCAIGPSVQSLLECQNRLELFRTAHCQNYSKLIRTFQNYSQDSVVVGPHLIQLSCFSVSSLPQPCNYFSFSCCSSSSR